MTLHDLADPEGPCALIGRYEAIEPSEPATTHQINDTAFDRWNWVLGGFALMAVTLGMWLSVGRMAG